MNATQTVGDFITVLIPYYAELFCTEGITEKLFELRYNALRQVQANLMFYQERGYRSELLERIAARKAALIMSANSISEVEKIIRPRAPHFDGVRFIPDPYLLPEEELICWSETSLRAPLNEAGYQRYMTLLRQIFPEESEALNIA